MTHGNSKAKPRVDPGDNTSNGYPALEDTPIGASFSPREGDMDDVYDSEAVVPHPSKADNLDDAGGHSVTFTCFGGLEGEVEGEDLPTGRFAPGTPGLSELDEFGTMEDESGIGDATAASEPTSPVSCQALPSGNSTRSLEHNSTTKSVENSCLSKESIVSLTNLKKSHMSEHLEHCKEVAFKQRMRTSGFLCALGLLFVLSGVGVVLATLRVNLGEVVMIRALAVAFLLFGLVSFLLALLPTDRRAVPVAAWTLFVFFLLFGGICSNIGLIYLLEDHQALQAGEAAVTYIKFSVIVCAGLVFFFLAFYLIAEVCRPRRNRQLLSRMWYVSQLFFAIVAFLSTQEAFVDFAETGPSGLYWLIASVAATICTFIARSKECQSKVQTCLGARGESAGSAAAVAALVGSFKVEEVLEIARCSFFTVKADRLKMEHMVSSEVDPSYKLGKLARRTRLGEADAFISHSWTDDPLAKWSALQGWRKHFKRQHQAEPRLWIDKYCIDQNDFKNSLACLPIYLASCSKMVVICGETYLTRLWCVIELFVFLEMGGSLENLEVIILPDPENRIADQILDFDPSNLQCSQAETADVLQSVLEAGRSGLDGIRDLVHQRFASKAQRRLHPDVPKKPFRPERPERAPEVHVTLQDKHFAEDKCFSI